MLELVLEVVVGEVFEVEKEEKVEVEEEEALEGLSRVRYISLHVSFTQYLAEQRYNHDDDI